MDEYLKKLMDRLTVCLTYAGEDIDDFLWVLDQDEKDGSAPEDVDRLRSLYGQIRDQYAQDGKELSDFSDAERLDLAVHIVEVYQAMFDYLMSGDEADYTGQPVDAAAVGKPRLGPRDADFSAMFELFRKNKDLPS